MVYKNYKMEIRTREISSRAKNKGQEHTDGKTETSMRETGLVTRETVLAYNFGKTEAYIVANGSKICSTAKVLSGGRTATCTKGSL